MIKKYIVLSLGLFLLSGTLPATSQTRQKTALIDVDKILSSLKEAEEVQKKVQDLRKKIMAEGQKLQSTIVAVQNDIQTIEKSLKVNDMTKNILQAGIQQLQQQIQQFQSQTLGPGGELERRSAKLLEPVIKKIREATDQIRFAEKIDLVLHKNQILAVNEETSTALDITQKVLDRIVEQELNPK